MIFKEIANMEDVGVICHYLRSSHKDSLLRDVCTVEYKKKGIWRSWWMNMNWSVKGIALKQKYFII